MVRKGSVPWRSYWGEQQLYVSRGMLEEEKLAIMVREGISMRGRRREEAV
jgi:hypothetical protein